MVKWDKVFNSKFLSALNRSGVTGVYLNSEANYKKVLVTIKENNKKGKTINIKIIAYNGCDLLTYIKEPLKEAIKNNAKVRIIIAERESEFIKDTWKLEGIHENKTFEEMVKENRKKEETAFGIIKELLETAVKEGGNFKYKRYTTQARYALIAINKSWGWWTPYQTGIKVQDTTYYSRSVYRPFQYFVEFFT